MTECEHEVLEKCGFEVYACKECGIEIDVSKWLEVKNNE